MSKNDSTTIPMKRCSKCKVEYSATPEYFARDKNRKDGLYPQCKPCHHASKNKDYSENADARRAAANEWSSGNREEKNRRNRRWYYSDVNHARELGRSSHQRHKDARNAYLRNKRAENPQAHRDEVRAWQLANPEKAREARRVYYQSTRDIQLAKRKMYYKQNPTRFRVNSMRRKKRIKEAEGMFTHKDILAKEKAQKMRCHYCGQKFTNGKYHIEHVVPISRGGTNWPDNIVLACAACNMEKHDKMPHEWTRGGRLL